ncbi:hypothetical protein D3C73_1108430 [compost metagenome]|uniref:hypothetical protein n=1 Tax=Paenibacillus graminis TaxID=189425 RepID=UPI000FA6188D|nr:hypothetical protein [Paenibacillus graminis]MEC0168621.1 hypothetical protein [Paenibacillus graminis]
MSALITNEQLYDQFGTFAHPDFTIEKERGYVRFVFKSLTEGDIREFGYLFYVYLYAVYT